ncbi:TraR/DksA C4-type zinc finger protein [Acetohalobium arabaticum]|uniref:Transcriptional regulator, TraR/DksA family n=1 Tax=Acetohalobium arabaticum (strain ATCC 49924 / DSM 5501 / Z-7288) TaxID=574087 RepID=D9QPI2_ACEAZ|nr:TraR/DksA C4-type zinc finger protein [Acetohalobium arabaticum]ADL12423.1 transcriptional regulator, TraR/DksA family [Acetohalobium arabaticum DSM 5501]
MTEYNEEYYREKLLQERERIIEQIESFDDKNYTGLHHSLKDSTSELSTYDNHPSDQAPNTFEREKDLGLKDNAYRLLQKIDDALERIETGDYGICDICQEEINRERLDFIPYTTRCVECNRAQAEEEEETTNRPVAEDPLGHPFGRTFNDDTESISFDGEDSWQSVAQYGTVNTPSDISEAVKQAEAYIDADENQGSVEWGDRVTDQGFTTGDEEYNDENLLSEQPTVDGEVEDSEE